MSFAPLPLAPPPSARIVLESGTVFHLLPDREVPLVNVKILVRTGAVLDPPDRTGLAELTGRLMRTGGTRDLRAEELDEALEGMGAVLQTNIGREAGNIALSVLSDDLDRGIGLLAQVLRFPVFSPREVEKEKNRTLERIRRSDDDPDEIAFRLFRSAVYGNDPRGRTPSVGTVSAVTPSDLAAFHRRHFHPDRILVGVSGDFTEEALLESWQRYFGDWQPSGLPAEPYPVPSGPAPRTVSLSAKAFPQSTILMGHLAPALDSPDLYAFSLLNYVLGGAGFNSRLTEEIRSNRGLAYSVGSWYRGAAGYGVFVTFCRTGAETTLEAARLLEEIVEDARREGVTADELQWAKDSVINGLVFSLESSAEIVARRLSYEYNGLPPDFLERYPDRLRAVTAEEVKDVARRYLRPGEAPMVFVGDESRFEGGLEAFGAVRRIPLDRY